MKRILFLLILLVIQVRAQYYFGKNKIQYKNFNFKQIETDHFKILFYQGGEGLAQFAAGVLERTYSRYIRDFGREIDFTIPVIIYNSTGDFSQTNVILELIDEGVGGFTEIFKNRIVVPFTGSYYEFSHVLQHELVHVFQFQIFNNVLSDVFAFTPYEPPPWVTEGLAEFCSSHGRNDYIPFMQDMLLNDNLVKLDRLSNLYGYLVYKEGESVFLFIEDKYGRRKVFEFINALKYKKSIKGAVRSVFGVSFEEFSEAWLDYLKLNFWKDIDKKPFYNEHVEVLFKHRKSSGIYNYSPVFSPDGSKIAFVSDKEGYTNVYIISSFDGKIIRKLVKGEQDKKYENIPILRKLLWWLDDENLAMVIHSEGRDRIYIVSYPEGRIVEKLDPGVDMIKDVNGDGKRIIFSGVKDGMTDIYIYDKGKVKRLLFDSYEDRNPVFLHGDTFLFFSDRDTNWVPGNYSIMMGVIKENHADIIPLTEHIGRIYSLSVDKKRGIVWVIRGKERMISAYALTGFYLGDIYLPGGVYTVDFSEERNSLVFSHFFDMGWNVSLIEKPADFLKEYKSMEEDFYEVSQYETEEPERYRVSFSLDYLYGGFAYSSIYGMSGGLNLAFSDLLGNHRFYFFSDLNSDIETSNIYFSYFYLEKRLDLGLGVFQVTNYYYVDGDTILEERWRGGGFNIVYPFSKFLRFEFNPFLFYVRDIYFSYETFRIYRVENYPLSYMDFALVGDNVLYYWYSPYTGMRWRAEFYFPVPQEFYTGYIDLRKYLKVVYPRFSFAFRGLLAGSFGEKVERFYIGGLYGVRGVETEEMVTGSYIGFANIEFRFPLIEEIRFGFPRFSLRGIRGAVFMDGGIAQDTITSLESSRFILSGGGAIRWFIFYFPISIEFAYPLIGEEDKKWAIYINLYPEF